MKVRNRPHVEVDRDTPRLIENFARLYKLRYVPPEEYAPELLEFSETWTENAFCKTGKGGGVKATCGDGAASTDKNKLAPKLAKPAASSSLESGKAVVGSLPKAEGLFGKVTERLSKIGASAKHAEHVAASYAKDKIGAAVAKLPGPVRAVVEKSYALGKLGTKAAFVTWSTGQALAERVAKERGFTDEQARRLRGVLSTSDIVAMKPITIGLGATGIGAAAAGALSMIPPATAGYLAYSTARNPLATARAAKGLIVDAFKSWQKKPAVNALVFNDEEDNMKLLTDVLESYDFDDWFIALFHTAMDETGDMRDALRIAAQVYEEQGENPTDEEDAAAGEELFVEEEPAENAFCPTGEGGGQDNSCGKGGSPRKVVRDIKTGDVLVAPDGERRKVAGAELTGGGRVHIKYEGGKKAPPQRGSRLLGSAGVAEVNPKSGILKSKGAKAKAESVRVMLRAWDPEQGKRLAKVMHELGAVNKQIKAGRDSKGLLAKRAEDIKGELGKIRAEAREKFKDMPVPDKFRREQRPKKDVLKVEMIPPEQVRGRGLAEVVKDAKKKSKPDTAERDRQFKSFLDKQAKGVQDKSEELKKGTLPGYDDGTPEAKMARSGAKERKPLEGGVGEDKWKVTLENGVQGAWKPAHGEPAGLRQHVKAGTYYKREAAAYEVAKVIGLHDLVPPTVIREIDGKKGSFQEWQTGAKTAKDLSERDKFDGEEDHARSAAFDYLIGHNDRHGGNWMLGGDAGSSKLRLIDNGLSFPTAVGGFGNHQIVERARVKNLPVPKAVLEWDKDKIVGAAKKMGIEDEAVGLMELRLEKLKERASAGKRVPKSWENYR